MDGTVTNGDVCTVYVSKRDGKTATRRHVELF